MQTSRDTIQSADEAICHRSERVLVPCGNKHDMKKQINQMIKLKEHPDWKINNYIN